MRLSYIANTHRQTHARTHTHTIWCNTGSVSLKFSCLFTGMRAAVDPGGRRILRMDKHLHSEDCMCFAALYVQRIYYAAALLLAQIYRGKL